MTAKYDTLTEAVDRLECELAEAARWAREWAGRVDQELGGVERAIRQHAGEHAPHGAPAPGIDRPLIPSPGLARRTAGLRRDLEGLLNETGALRAKVQRIAQSPGAQLVTEAIANVGVLSQRARRLAAALESYE